MKQRLLQKIADSLINKLETIQDNDLFQFYYEMSMWYNDFCVFYLNVYLD